MNVLVAVQQLGPFAGAALVAIEAAQVFKRLGHTVTMCAAYIANPAKDYMSKNGLRALEVSEITQLTSFDLIWSQDHIVPALLADLELGDKIPRIFSVSLSPYDLFAMPGAIAALSEKILANSFETADHLKSFGIPPERISVFHNAAPQEFRVNRPRREKLTSVLVVANHAPPEVGVAVKILKERGIDVLKIGFPQEQILVTPELLERFDAVVTIGKTAQYAINSRMPVYLYDRFGGPGWLSLANADQAAYFNFSGRCCNTKLSGEQIADEIVSGYEEASFDADALFQHFGERFNLDFQIRHLLEPSKAISDLQKCALDTVRREGVLAKYANAAFVKLHQCAVEIDALERKNSELSSEVLHYKSEISGHGQAVESFQAITAKMEREHASHIDTMKQRLDAALFDFRATKNELEQVKSSNIFKIMRFFSLVKK